MRRALPFLLGVTVIAACHHADSGAGSSAAGGSSSSGSGASETIAVATIEGAPAAGAEADSDATAMDEAPTMLSILHGGVAIATTAGMYETQVSGDGLAEVPAVDDDGDVIDVGSALELTRRSSGGLFLRASSGLYADEDGLFLASPLAKSLDGMKIESLDALGAEGLEELWIATDSGALHVANGSAESFAIEGATTTPSAIVAFGPYKAVALAGEAAWIVDLVAGDATRLDAKIGEVTAFDHGDDGAAFVATKSGVLRVSATGDATLYTLAAKGAEPREVLGVSAAYGAIFAATSDELVTLDDHGSKHIAKIGAATRAGLATDANGDVWAIDGSSLVRFKTGKPVSFAADVVPFVKAHCATCHANGSNQAPMHDFTDYATAEMYAATIVQKLEAPAGMGVMPPADVEKLTPADYSVVTRWVDGGEQP